MIEQQSPREVAARLEGADPPLLVDVREPWERELASVAGSVAIPMAEVPQRLDELPADRDLVLLCHHGRRSQAVAEYLEQRGRTRLTNLVGGIDAWSLDVDPQISRYS